MGLCEALSRTPSWVRLLRGLAILRLLFAAIVPLTPEEAYHWNFARHLDWSYFDHPPMIAWSIATGRLLFGDTALGVRFVPVLFATGTCALLARLAGRTYGGTAPFWAVAFFSLQPITFAASGTGFPDSPLLFFWTLAMVLTAEAMASGRGPLWLGAGAALGCAMLSKYTAVFFGLSVLIHLLLSRRDRRWLATPWPYLAGALAIAVFSPVILWNYAHDWASFRFQSVERFEQVEGISPLGAARFLGQQGAGVLPFLLPLAGLALLHTARSPRPEERFLFWCSAPLLGFFFALSWTRPIHLMWPLAAYLSLTAAMAGLASEGKDAASRFYVRGRRWILGSFAAGLLAMSLHAACFLPGFSPFKGLYGWEAVADRARALQGEMAAGSVYIGLGRKYTVASQLAFHLRDPFRVHGKNLLGQQGLQYEAWSDGPSLAGRDAIVVVEAGDRESEYLYNLRVRFQRVDPAGELEVPVGRRTVLATPSLRFAFFKAFGYMPPPTSLTATSGR